MRRHKRTRPELDNVIDNNPLTRLEPIENDPVFPYPVARHDWSYCCFVFVIDNIYRLAQIGSLYGDLRDEKNAVALAGNDTRPYELPGQQAPLAVVEGSAQLLRTQFRVDPAGCKIQFAFFLVLRAVPQNQRHLLYPVFGKGTTNTRQFVVGKAEAYPYGR